MAWVYGIAGIGKTTLLARFRQECDRRGARVVALDCQTIEPTESGFAAALAAAAGQSASPIDDLLASLTCERPVIVTIDTYEVFRIADPWLRHSLVPRWARTSGLSSGDENLRRWSGRPNGPASAG
jgi:hypothetical protein